MQSFRDIRVAVQKGHVPVSSTISALAHLDFAEKALGARFHSAPVPASEAEFNAMFPREPDTKLLVNFGTPSFYRRWRAALERLCVLAQLWPADPFILLNQIGKLAGIRPIERCVFTRHFPGLSPKDATQQLARDADRDLRGMVRNQFRRNMANLDRLRAVPMVRTHGLLPPEPIGPFPRYRDGERLRIELPEHLRAACASDPKLNLAHVRRAYEICVDLEFVQSGQAMPTGGFTDHHAREFHIEASRISRASADRYLRAILRALRTLDPDLVLDDQSVASILWPDRPNKKISKGTDKEKCQAIPPSPLPAGIEASLQKFQAARKKPPKYMSTLRRVLHRILEQDPGETIDVFALSAGADLEVLFPEILPSTRRAYRSALKAFLAFTGDTDPWDDLRDIAKNQGMPEQRLKGITTLKRYARAAPHPLSPGEITRTIGLQWRGDALEKGRRSDAQKIRQGCLALDNLRPLNPNLLGPEPIGQLDDLRRGGNLSLPATLEYMLEQHAAQAGFSKFGTKALLVAMRKLYTCSRTRTRFHDPMNASLVRSLLMEAVQDHPEAMTPYQSQLARFAERLDVLWSDGWRRLQTAVVAEGIPRGANPLEELAKVAVPGGLEPWQVDREWAWQHERALRPDLRLTWARNIDHFDRFRTNEAVAAADLLPPVRLGPMPPRGTRLKNAVYPLPAQVEATVEGASKPLLEAMHFVWRCARDLGIWDRGDAPTARELFHDSILDDVECRQDKMTRRWAHIHLDRIREWREDHIGLFA